MASNDEYQQRRSFEDKKRVSLMTELEKYCEKFTAEFDIFWQERYNKALLEAQEEYRNRII